MILDAWTEDSLLGGREAGTAWHATAWPTTPCSSKLGLERAWTTQNDSE